MYFAAPDPVVAGRRVEVTAKLGISSRHYRALAEFRFQIRKFLHFSETAVLAAGIEPQQHQLLLVVKAFTGSRDGPTIGYIAERLQVRHHSAVELITRMEARGLLCRQAAERDRRQVIVALTDRGEFLLDSLSTVHLQEVQQIGPKLVATLQEVLSKESDAGADGVEHS